jgi:archaellum component FlaC
MLEYDIHEAVALLEKNYSNVEKTVQQLTEDLVIVNSYL